MRNPLPILFLLTVADLPGQVLTTSNLPIVSIKTGGQTIPDEPKLTARMHIVEPSGGLAILADTANLPSEFIGIEKRGTTSQQQFPKVGFAIETRDSTGASKNIEPLGFPKENDWVLVGPYNDKSLMRDALAYSIASESMVYAPRASFVELVVDDDYRGVYLFTEKIKRDKNRVNISKLNPTDTSGDQLTGGYILKLDKLTGSGFDGWASGFAPSPGAAQRSFFQYHYPKPDQIAAEQKAYIQSFIEEMEAAFSGDDFKDSVDGYERFIDVDSWLGYLFVNEATKNLDAYRLSTFMFKDRHSADGRLYMGPVWDFNIAFGISGFCQSGPSEGWAFDIIKEYCPEDEWQVPFWWKRLLSDPRFLGKMASKWRNLRAGAWSDEHMLGTIDSMQNLLAEAQARNFERWPILGNYVWPDYDIGPTWESEVAYLRRWLADRLHWMDGQIEAFDLNAPPRQPLKSTRPMPNPARGATVFDYQTDSFVDLQLELLDASGRLVERQRELPTGRNARFELPLPPVAGVYYYRFQLAGSTAATGKIVVMP